MMLRPKGRAKSIIICIHKVLVNQRRKLIVQHVIVRHGWNRYTGIRRWITWKKPAPLHRKLTPELYHHQPIEIVPETIIHEIKKFFFFQMIFCQKLMTSSFDVMISAYMPATLSTAPMQQLIRKYCRWTSTLIFQRFAIPIVYLWGALLSLKVIRRDIERAQSLTSNQGKIRLAR